MIDNKRISIIGAIVIIIAFILGIVVIGIGNKQAQLSEAGENTMVEASYAQEIFGVDIISIEIVAEESDWQTMIDNAISEQYIMVDVIVNGTKFEKVGIRPKGNSSLTQIASNDTTDRFSFRLQFDEYIDGQTCFGLESFVVNNMLGDNTYMKEYISYELMESLGVDAPYFGYADIKLNGEDWGLYLAVELYNKSYEERVYGDTTGMLYNVKSMEMGNNEDKTMGERPMDMPSGAGGTRPEGRVKAGGIMGETQTSGEAVSPTTTGEIPTGEGTTPPDGTSEITGGGGMGGRSSSGGGSLEYTDDQASSYSAIFDNVVGKGNDADYAKVIDALKALSEGSELEKYFDINQILKYLAAHTLIVNLDSYSSSMAQNYYIYERNGQLTILPWDYNMAWGGFQSGSASSVINFPIDTPVSGVEMSTRPLIEKLFENTEYLATYHSYLQKMVDEYFSDGRFEIKVQELNTLIASYVEKDKTALCTYEEYKKAVQVFIELGNLRAESVQGQLNGTIPSTIAEQKTDADKLISGETINISDLGSMMGGRGENKNSTMPSTEGTTPPTPTAGGGFGGRGNSSVGNSTAINNALQWSVLGIALILASAIVARFKKKY